MGQLDVDNEHHKMAEAAIHGYLSRRWVQHKWEASARVTRLILSDPQFVLEPFKWANWTLPEMLPIEPGA